MAPEEFEALEGLVQWAYDVVAQAKHVAAAEAEPPWSVHPLHPDFVKNRRRGHAVEAACHHFAIAAYQLLEYRDWAVRLGLCAGVDFSEIDQFSKDDIRDLRNMREHKRDYLQGEGHHQNRWFTMKPNLVANAGSKVGSMIGGRLDWIKFSAATERVLPQLMAELISWHQELFRGSRPPNK
jgi:hypothetical protein